MWYQFPTPVDGAEELVQFVAVDEDVSRIVLPAPCPFDDFVTLMGGDPLSPTTRANDRSPLLVVEKSETYVSLN